MQPFVDVNLIGAMATSDNITVFPVESLPLPLGATHCVLSQKNVFTSSKRGIVGWKTLTAGGGRWKWGGEQEMLQGFLNPSQRIFDNPNQIKY